jgi:hypothetical protein
MNEPRRQHLLPQFYLRRFADKAGRINVFLRAGQPGATAPSTAKTNVLVERDYYTVTDESDAESFVIEEAFAQLEAKASVSLRVLLEDGLVLDAHQRAAWSEFMALQVTRGRQFREVYEDFSERVAKASLREVAVHAPPEYFDQISAALLERGEEPLPPMTPERRREVAEGDAFTIRPSREDAIQMSMAALTDMPSIFFQMSWQLLRLHEPCLLMSDHPYIRFDPGTLPGRPATGDVPARPHRLAVHAARLPAGSRRRPGFARCPGAPLGLQSRSGSRDPRVRRGLATRTQADSPNELRTRPITVPGATGEPSVDG